MKEIKGSRSSAKKAAKLQSENQKTLNIPYIQWYEGLTEVEKLQLKCMRLEDEMNLHKNISNQRRLKIDDLHQVIRELRKELLSAKKSYK